MPAIQRPPQYFGNISALDERLRFVDLAAQFPSGDAPAGTPTVSILPIAGDTNPLVLIGPASWDTGSRNVFVGPYGAPYLSAGPRILFSVQGGTKGNTYTVMLSWQDSEGQVVNMPVYQYIQWDATG